MSAPELMDLPLKGARKYIQSATIVEHLSPMRERWANFETARLEISFKRFAIKQLLLWEEEPPVEVEVSTEAIFWHDDAKKQLWLSESDTPIHHVVDCHESEVMPLCVFEPDRVTLSAPSRLSVMDTLVAMSKFMHQRQFGTDKGRWVVTRFECEDVLLRSQPACPIGLSVTIERKIPQFTLSRIELDGEYAGKVFYSVVS